MATEVQNDDRKQWKIALKAAFPYTLPTLAGFVVLSLAYGMLMESKGYGPLWSIMFSAVVFGGSIQFAAIPLLGAFNPIQAFLLSFMVNARHLFYGISMLNIYKGFGKIRMPLIFMLCDETFSIVSSIAPPTHVHKKYFFFWISFLNYSYWVIGTCLGGLIGSSVSFNTRGMDFVLSALFVVILLEQVRTPSNRVPALIGIVSSCLGLALFGAGNMVIPSMCILLVVLLAGRKLCR